MERTRNLDRSVDFRQEILPGRNARSVIELVGKIVGGKGDASHGVARAQDTPLSVRRYCKSAAKSNAIAAADFARVRAWFATG